MSHFNLALVPEEKQLVQTCIDLAQANCAGKASDYLLGNNAYPHITLCQFDIEADSEQLLELWLSLKNLQIGRIRLKFTHIYIMPRIDMHSDKFWLGLAVGLTSTLADLQRAAYERLTGLRIASKTLPQSYFPHLTWARCLYDKTLQFALLPPAQFWENEYCFVMSLGRSDQNGAYQETLYPAS